MAGRLAGIGGRVDIAAGQRGEGQRRIHDTLHVPADLGGAVERLERDGAALVCLSAVREHVAQARPGVHLPDQRVRGVRFGHQLAILRLSPGDIPEHQLRSTQTPAAPARVAPVADLVGEVAALRRGRECGVEITRADCCRERLAVEDLAQPPPVADGSGQILRF